MLDEYKLKGSVQKVELEIEADVAKKLKEMTGYMKFSEAEIVNTALKRFISSHQDFFPPHFRSSSHKKSA